MACRRSLLLASVLVLTAGPGCTPQGNWLTSSSSRGDVPARPAATATASKPSADDQPKRTPKAGTCVALGAFREQEADNPDLPPAEQTRLREDARKAYQQALRIDPDNVEATAALAHFFAKQGDFERAVATYQTALKAHPNHPGLWYDLGMCQTRWACTTGKDWQPAIDSLQKASDLDQENRAYALALGFCLARAGHYQEAAACFGKVVSPAEALYRVAQMQHHLQQDDLCVQNLQTAMRLDPQFAPAQQLLTQLQQGTAPAANPLLQAGYQEPDDGR
jgi:tetratricopeptide (TPR) repeat protein